MRSLAAIFCFTLVAWLAPVQPTFALPSPSFPFAAPAPAPQLPSFADAYAPPVLASTAVDPQSLGIAEWTRSALVGDTVVATGSRFAGEAGLSISVFSQRGSAPGKLLSAPLRRVQGYSLTFTIPPELPERGMFLAWVHSSKGFAKPIAINRTELWWVGPRTVARGSEFDLFGRNLSFEGGNIHSAVYLMRKDGTLGQWLPVRSVNPFKVTAQLPHSLPAGEYSVWVHNGHGGAFGWSEPTSLTVRDPLVFNGPTINVRNFGAVGNGVADDTDAIVAAVAALSGSQRSRLYFPAGHYRLGRGLSLANVEMFGDGKDLTTIQANSRFRDGTAGGEPHFLYHGSHWTIRDLTIDTRGFERPGGTLAPHRDSEFITYKNVRFATLGTIDFHDADNIELVNSEFIIGEEIFLGAASQVRIIGNRFRMSHDATTAIMEWGSKEVSVIGNSFENFNPSSPTGWGMGRAFTGNGIWGSSSDFYFAENITLDLAPRADRGPDGNYLVDQNSGEQFMWEGANKSRLTSSVSGSSVNSARLSKTLAQHLAGTMATFTSVQGTQISRPILFFDTDGRGGTLTSALGTTINLSAGVTIAEMNFKLASASGTTFRFGDLAPGVPEDVYRKLIGFDVTVVDGVGIGQTRRISALGSDRATFIVTPPWTLPPGTGSKVVIGTMVSRVAFHHNSLSAPEGISSQVGHVASSGVQPYGGCRDFIIADNVFDGLRSAVSLWGIGVSRGNDEGLQPTFGVIVEDNSVVRSNNGVSIVGETMRSDGGTHLLDLVIRRNVMSDSASIIDPLNRASAPSSFVKLMWFGAAHTVDALQGAVIQENTVLNSSGELLRVEPPQPGRGFLPFPYGSLLLIDNTASFRSVPGLPSRPCISFRAARPVYLMGNRCDQYPSTVESPSSIATVDVPHRHLAFGGVVEGSILPVSFTIENRGITSAPVEVRSRESWLRITTPQMLLPSNSAAQILAEIDPRGLVPGELSGSVTIEGSSLGPIELRVKSALLAPLRQPPLTPTPEVRPPLVTAVSIGRSTRGQAPVKVCNRGDRRSQPARSNLTWFKKSVAPVALGSVRVPALAPGACRTIQHVFDGSRIPPQSGSLRAAITGPHANTSSRPTRRLR